MVNYAGNYRSLTSERVLGNRFAVSATHSLPSPTSFSVFCPSYPPQPAGATTLMRGSIRLLGSTLIYQLFAKLTAQAPSLSFAKGCQLSSHESTCSAATIFCPVQSETAHPSIHPSIHTLHSRYVGRFCATANCTTSQSRGAHLRASQLSANLPRDPLHIQPRILAACAGVWLGRCPTRAFSLPGVGLDYPGPKLCTDLFGPSDVSTRFFLRWT